MTKTSPEAAQIGLGESRTIDFTNQSRSMAQTLLLAARDNASVTRIVVIRKANQARPVVDGFNMQEEDSLGHTVACTYVRHPNV